MAAADIHAAEQHQNHASHQDAGHDVDDHDVAPAHAGEQPAGGERRQRIADIAAHAVDRDDKSLALRKRARQERDRRRVPEIIADADETGAGEQRPVRVREAHQQIGRADPAQRERHEQALARHRIGDHAAGNVGQRAAHELAGQDRTDLLIAEVQLVADQRQQQIKRRRIPMGERVAERDQPDIGKRPGNAPRRGYWQVSSSRQGCFLLDVPAEYSLWHRVFGTDFAVKPFCRKGHGHMQISRAANTISHSDAARRVPATRSRMLNKVCSSGTAYRSSIAVKISPAAGTHSAYKRHPQNRQSLMPIVLSCGQPLSAPSSRQACSARRRHLKTPNPRR